MGRTVSSPDGNRWYVRRVWLPWRPRRRKPVDGLDVPLDLAPGCADDLVGGVVGAIVVIVVIAVVLVLVVPLLVTVLEVLLVLLLAVLGGVARVVLRRPWVVEATPATGPGRLRWKVVGWRRSGEVVDAVAQQLAAGQRAVAVPDATPC